MTDAPSKQTKAELAKQASAILKRAHCDARSGAKKDKQYRRNKSAENKRLAATGATEGRSLESSVQPLRSGAFRRKTAEVSGAEGGDSLRLRDDIASLPKEAVGVVPSHGLRREPA